MAHKKGHRRGGIAGIWDRNKHIIKPVAQGAGFLFGGPAGAAAVGGAIGGFDRRGKGGIGFDVGQGAMGALKGYAGGKLAQGFGIEGGGGMNTLKSMFRHPLKAAGQGFRTIGDIPSNVMRLGREAGAVGQAVGMRAGDAARGVGRWAAKDPMNLLALGQTAMGGLNAYGQAQQNNLLAQQGQLSADRAAQQAKIREMLLPYFQQYMAQMGNR